MGKTDITLASAKREKDVGIELLKFFSAIIIVNSHMGELYVHYPQLATGGAIGDAIFFFCSGYGLFLARKRSFFDYYKRRIARIYPSVFAWAILSSLLFNNNSNMMHIILYGGGWFVTCIMIYYIFFWFIHRYMIHRLIYLIYITFGLSILWFFLFDSCNYINIYGDGSSKFIFFFGFMLLGGYLGYLRKTDSKNLSFSISMFFISVVAFYGFLYVSKVLRAVWEIEIISIFALISIVFYSWRLCNTNYLKRIYNKYKICGFVGGLCLEMYIVQEDLFTKKMNELFPLNLLLMLIIVIISAYVLRCCARLFAQIFQPEEIEWKKIIKS